MDITARKKVPTGIFSLETYFLHFIQGNIGEPILLHVFLLGAFFSSDKSSIKYGSPENNC
jgi:hypothetical protein